MMRTEGFDFPASNAERPYIEIAADCSSVEIHFRNYGSGRIVVATALPAPTTNAFLAARQEPLKLTGLAAEDRVFFQPGGTGDVSITALIIDAA